MKQVAFTVFIPVMIVAALVRMVCDWILDLPFPEWHV